MKTGYITLDLEGVNVTTLHGDPVPGLAERIKEVIASGKPVLLSSLTLTTNTARTYTMPSCFGCCISDPQFFKEGSGEIALIQTNALRVGTQLVNLFISESGTIRFGVS